MERIIVGLPDAHTFIVERLSQFMLAFFYSFINGISDIGIQIIDLVVVQRSVFPCQASRNTCSSLPL
ncbi:MAG: hypothetical protein U5K84_00530 [Alkalibacterium sp.]|nr:hypothetical protein [Alkalibacterium sp.]